MRTCECPSLKVFFVFRVVVDVNKYLEEIELPVCFTYAQRSTITHLVNKPWGRALFRNSINIGFILHKRIINHGEKDTYTQVWSGLRIRIQAFWPDPGVLP